MDFGFLGVLVGVDKRDISIAVRSTEYGVVYEEWILSPEVVDSFPTSDPDQKSKRHNHNS